MNMNVDNDFDKRLEANKGMPDEFRTALVEATDTLSFCWTAVQSVFGDKAQPDHAIEFCNTVLKLRLSNKEETNRLLQHK